MLKRILWNKKHLAIYLLSSLSVSSFAESSLLINGSLNFGDTLEGQDVTTRIYLKSQGQGSLTVSDLGFSDEVEIEPALPITLDDQAWQSVDIRFKASSELNITDFSLSDTEKNDLSPFIKTDTAVNIPETLVYHHVLEEDIGDKGWLYRGGDYPQHDLFNDQTLLSGAHAMVVSDNGAVLAVRGENTLSVYTRRPNGKLDPNQVYNPSDDKQTLLEGSTGYLAISPSGRDIYLLHTDTKKLTHLHNYNRNCHNYATKNCSSMFHVQGDNLDGNFLDPFSDLLVEPQHIAYVDDNPEAYFDDLYIFDAAGPSVLVFPDVVDEGGLAHYSEFSDFTFDEFAQKHELNIPVEVDDAEKLFAVSKDGYHIAVATSLDTVSIFHKTDDGFALQNHFDSGDLRGLASLGALAFSPSGRHLYTVTKPSLPDERFEKQQITTFGLTKTGEWYFKGGMRNTENKTNLVIGGTSIQFSGNQQTMFIAAAPKVLDGQQVSKQFRPVEYFSDPRTGELNLLSSNGMEHVELELDIDAKTPRQNLAVTSNWVMSNSSGRLVYTLAGDHLATYNKFSRSRPHFVRSEALNNDVLHDIRYGSTGLMNLVELNPGGLGPSGGYRSTVEVDDILVEGGTLAFVPKSECRYWCRTLISMKPSTNAFGTMTLKIPANSFNDDSGLPNYEGRTATYNVIPSLIPQLSYDQAPIPYGETRVINIDFGQAVERFTEKNFPWSLFEAELVHVETMATGYALTIKPATNTDGVMSFVLEDGVLSAADNEKVKNLAIPETKLIVKAITQ